MKIVAACYSEIRSLNNFCLHLSDIQLPVTNKDQKIFVKVFKKRIILASKVSQIF